jgi:hypothetical protein
VATFVVDPTSMRVAVAEPEDFIIFLSDKVTANRVYNVGSPLHRPAFSLFFKRWTRLARADAAVLTVPVELEL